jgi:DNA-binding GntR family transcriptional regulator
MPATKTKQPLSSIAYQAIYRRIVSLAYEPGQRLEEGQLVKELGIGRTPVREALVTLVADMLVETQAGRGYLVRPITLQNTKAAFSALKILELGVAELAVRQELSDGLTRLSEANAAVAKAVQSKDILALVEANSVFHHHFAVCSRNPYLIQALQRVRCEINRLAYLSYGNEIDPDRSLKDHYQSVLRQHGALVEALGQRDESRLRQVLCEHIEIFKHRMVSYLTA